jgi:hypothetical protein
MNLFTSVILIAITVASLASAYIAAKKLNHLNEALERIAELDVSINLFLWKISDKAEKNLPSDPDEDGNYPAWHTLANYPYSAGGSSTYALHKNAVHTVLLSINDEHLTGDAKRKYDEEIAPVILQFKEQVERHDQLALELSQDPVISRFVKHLPKPLMPQAY